MKKVIATALFFLMCSAAAAQETASPAIVKNSGRTELTLPKKMQTALDNVLGRFVPLKTSDFAPFVTAFEHWQGSTNNVPYAVVLDANKDGVQDVVLLGRAGKELVLAAVLSRGTDYEATTIQSFGNGMPKSEVSYRGGKRQVGQTSWIETAKGGDAPGFLIMFPQLEDKGGNILNDPGIQEFRFTNGKFIEIVMEQ